MRIVLTIGSGIQLTTARAKADPINVSRNQGAWGRNSVTHSRKFRCFVSDIRGAFRHRGSKAVVLQECPDQALMIFGAPSTPLVVLGKLYPKENATPESHLHRRGHLGIKPFGIVDTQGVDDRAVQMIEQFRIVCRHGSIADGASQAPVLLFERSLFAHESR